MTDKLVPGQARDLNETVTTNRWAHLPAILGLAGTAFLLLALRLDLLAFLRGPEPYPPEWEWAHDPKTDPAALLPALLLGLSLVGLILLSGQRRLAGIGRAGAIWILVLATCLGLLFQLSLIGLNEGRIASQILTRLAQPWTISFYNVAISPIAADPVRFVDEFAQEVPRLREHAEHAASHPPGPVLAFRALLACMRAAPRLATAVIEAAPLSERHRQRARSKIGDPELATGLIGVLAMMLLAVLTIWPIALFAAMASGDRAAAIRCGILWLLVPGPALFFGSLDQVLALPVLLASSLLAVGFVRADSDRGLIGLALLAGLSAVVAIHLSYGAPVFLAMGGLSALVLGVHRPGWARRLILVTGVCGAVCAIGFFAPALVGHEPIGSLQAVLEIHETYYTAPRDYTLWLLYNPIDLAVFAGLPLIGLLLWRAARLLPAPTIAARRRPDRGDAVLAISLTILLALQLSGVVRGEVGRIWIPVMPFLLLAGVGIPRTAVRTSTLLGLCLLLVTIALRWSWKV